MRKLGVDFGSKRIGLSVSDPTNTIAQPIGYLKRSGIEKEFEQIKGYIGEFEIGEVIIGLPLDLKGNLSGSAKKASEYADLLQKELKIPVKKYDERFTTRQAEDVLIRADVSREKRREIIDSLAAVVILQNYLDAHK